MAKGGRANVVDELRELKIYEKNLSMEILRVPNVKDVNFEKNFNSMKMQSCLFKRIVTGEEVEELVQVDYRAAEGSSGFSLQHKWPEVEGKNYTIFVYKNKKEFDVEMNLKLRVGKGKNFMNAPYAMVPIVDGFAGQIVSRNDNLPQYLVTELKHLNYKFKLEPSFVFENGVFKELGKAFCDPIKIRPRK